MRTSIVKVIATSFILFSGASLSADLAGYETTCVDLGFKKRTPAFGECVLELDRRATDQQKQAERLRIDQQRQVQEQQQRQAEQQRQAQEQQQRQRATEAAARGDGTQEHQTCNQFGFVAGTPQYADCRLRIDIAKREAQQRQAAFEADKRRYEAEQLQYYAKLAEYEEERERQKGLAWLRFGSALMSGTSPYFGENLGNAGRAVLGLPPTPPTQPQVQTFVITNPAGRTTTCTTVANLINCF